MSKPTRFWKHLLFVTLAVLVATGALQEVSGIEAQEQRPPGEGAALLQPAAWQGVSQKEYTIWHVDVNHSCSYNDHRFTIEVDVEPEEISDLTLTLTAYDVDFTDPTGACEKGPEVDKVYINDHYLGILRGASDSWSTNTYQVDTNWINGATDTQPSGSNTIRVDTDATGTGCWCVGIGWAELKGKVGFQVLQHTPLGGANQLVDGKNPNITITFNRAYDQTTLTTDTFKVEYRNAAGSWQTVAGNIQSLSTKKAKFEPSAPLMDGVRYRVTVKAGANGVKGKGGGELAAEKEYRFWTMLDLDEQTAAVYPPSKVKDKLEIAVFQVARNEKLVPAKATLARVYIRWDKRNNVHEEDQASEAKFKLTVAKGTQKQSRTVSVKRPDLYQAADKKAARNSVNFYDWGITSGANQFKVTAEQLTQASSPPKTFSKTFNAATGDKSPKINFEYWYLKVGSWRTNPIPAAAKSAGRAQVLGGAKFTTDNFPVIGTYYTSMGEYSAFNYTFDRHDAAANVDYVKCNGAEPAIKERFCVYQQLWNARQASLTAKKERFVAGLVPGDGVTEDATAITWHKKLIIFTAGQGTESTVAHEIGHVYTLGHESSPNGIEGFRVRQKKNKSFAEGNGEFSTAPQIRSLMHPTSQPTLSRWVDNAQYRSLLGELGAASAVEAASAGQYLLVSGWLVGSTSAHLFPILMQDFANEPPPTSGEYSIELRDAGGALLSSTPFDVGMEDDDRVGTQTAAFSVMVPYVDTTQRVVVKHGATILAEVVRSANDPVISFTNPAPGTTWSGVQTTSWSGSDADGDQLTYYLQYSPDGEEWRPLSVGINDTSLIVDTITLIPGPDSWLKLRATDGFNTVEESIQVNIANGVVIEGTLPAADEVGASATGPMDIFFLNDMEPTQFTGDVFTLRQSGGSIVPGALTYDTEGRIASFTPNLPLAYNTQYDATLNAGLTDVVGNSLASAYSWSFTTEPDVFAPAVVNTSPALGDFDVPLNALIAAEFDEPMDGSTINASTFTLSGGVSGSVSYDAATRTALFRPAADLAADTSYVATLTTGFQDASGNGLEADYSWSFTTGSESSAGLRFTGSYADQAVDDDGDDLYDRLVVDVGVEVLADGVYNLNGKLEDAGGEEIEWATTGDVFLNAGVHTQQLVFSSDAIRSHGTNGPYILTDLHLYDTATGSYTWLADAYSTYVYDATQFHAVLTLTGLPDVNLNQGQSQEDVFNLNDYAQHATLPDSELTYTVDINTDPRSGVSIDADDNVDIQPEPGWVGFSDVTIKVTGGGLTAWDTFRVTVAPPGKTYLPLTLKVQPKPQPTPTPTPTPTPQSTGIHGKVTYRQNAAANTSLALRFYNGSVWSTRRTTRTDAGGRYLFTDVPSLGSSQTYYVRYDNEQADDRYVCCWFGPDITSYTVGSDAHGGNFDIATVELTAPPSGSTQTIPVTFYWNRRGIPGDSYRWILFDPDTGDWWWTDDLGDNGSFTLGALPSGVSYSKEYQWWVRVYKESDSYGLSYYLRRITFAPSAAGAASGLTMERGLGPLPQGEGLILPRPE